MNHTQYDYDKLFLAYEESRADITAHFRKIMELEREIEKLKEQNDMLVKQYKKHCSCGYFENKVPCSVCEVIKKYEMYGK